MSGAYIIRGWEKEKLESETGPFQGFQGSKWVLLTQCAPQSCFQFYSVTFPYEEKKSPLFWNVSAFEIIERRSGTLCSTWVVVVISSFTWYHLLTFRSICRQVICTKDSGAMIFSFCPAFNTKDHSTMMKPAGWNSSPARHEGQWQYERCGAALSFIASYPICLADWWRERSVY